MLNSKCSFIIQFELKEIITFDVKINIPGGIDFCPDDIVLLVCTYLVGAQQKNYFTDLKEGRETYLYLCVTCPGPINGMQLIACFDLIS